MDIFKKYLGKKVIIRSYASGVHFGTLSELSSDSSRSVILTDTRRVHAWSGACSLSQMAAEGVKNPSECRISMQIAEIGITQTEEILPLTDEAIANLESVPVWKS